MPNFRSSAGRQERIAFHSLKVPIFNWATESNEFLLLSIPRIWVGLKTLFCRVQRAVNTAHFWTCSIRSTLAIIVRFKLHEGASFFHLKRTMIEKLVKRRPHWCLSSLLFNEASRNDILTLVSIFFSHFKSRVLASKFEGTNDREITKSGIHGRQSILKQNITGACERKQICAQWSGKVSQEPQSRL